ncbi:hypothetical protein [Bradyrhizobium sp. UFLA05-112]
MADVETAAALAEERAVVVGATVEILAERFQEVREQRDALLDEVRMLRTAFQNLTAAFNRADNNRRQAVQAPG